MMENWKSELRKLKQQFNEETMKTQKNATISPESNEREFKRLKKWLGLYCYKLWTSLMKKD